VYASDLFIGIGFFIDDFSNLIFIEKMPFSGTWLSSLVSKVVS